MSDRTGTLDGVVAPAEKPPARARVPGWVWGFLKAFTPWAVVGATGYAVDVLLVQIQRRILWWERNP